MTISPKDLRIDNLLYQKNTALVAKISSISKSRFSCTDEFGVAIKEGLFEPITLTEQWLVRLGLDVKDDNPKQKPHYEGDILFYIGEFEFTNSMKDGFVCYCINNGNTVFQYVHELQNLYYSLTKKEMI